MTQGYVDADGHVMEDVEELRGFLDKAYHSARGNRAFTPSLDRFHTPSDRTPRTPGTFDPTVNADRWLEFMKRTGLEWSVLFPTMGLAYGQIVYPEWATEYARAYNNWLHETYLKRSSRLKGMALIPLQDPECAVQELRHAVKELGMVGAMLPSNGLNEHLSARKYWPVYAEAERLDCPLGVHGGCYGNLGFDTFTVFPATRALGMPFPLAIAMTGMIVDGVFDAFPNLRVGFLEGGSAWMPLVIDRLAREVEYGGLKVQRPIEAYFTDGHIFVGCEGNEKSLAYAIERVGPDPFMFASDFPHEISLDNCMEEIDEIRERTDLKEEHRDAILGGNARRFYKI